MKTYIEIARAGQIHDDFIAVSKLENIPLEAVIKDIASGEMIVVPSRSNNAPVAFGDRVRSKIICNIGTSSRSEDMTLEIAKAQIAVQSGASVMCDQSVGKNVGENRKQLINALKIPVISVPLYQNVDDAITKTNDPLNFSIDDIFDVCEKQLQDGVSMIGVHTMCCDLVSMLEKEERFMPVVSRGAGLMLEWIKKHHDENPYLKHFDRLLEVVKKYNVPITFVCSMRSGTVIDGYDKHQKFEWECMRDYIKRAHQQGVSVAVDGLGHMSIDQIPIAVQEFKKICFNIPLGSLGPATTDRGLGHEHIVNAIGTAVAVWSGANFCNACYKTEHLGLPEVDDIAEGISASLIATHVGDLARKHRKEILRKDEKNISLARRNNQWGIMLNYALDKQEAKETFARVGQDNVEGKGCSICGDLCPFVVTHQVQIDH